MRIRFLDHEIDTATHEFRAGDDTVSLEPQVFDLLHHLAASSGRLVTRDELIEKVWNGRIVSEATISSRINAARKAVGDDGTRQAVIKTVPRRGFRFVAPVETDAGESVRNADQPEDTTTEANAPAARRAQSVRFTLAPDGTRIAFAVSGQGPPLIRAGHWLTHLEHDWRSPIWQPFLSELGRDHTLIRYDQRGNGLSDWRVDDLSLDAFVGDLAALADAAGLESFPIYATSQGVPVAIEFAARHPDRVSRVILHSGYATGRLVRSEADREQGEAYVALMRHGWGAEGSQFLQAFASVFIPDGTPEQIRSLVELQKITTDAHTAVRLRTAFDNFQVIDRLSEICAPTLVIHGRNDGVHPLEESLKMAAAIPGAELVVLETRNHVILDHDPVRPEFFETIRRFLGHES